MCNIVKRLSQVSVFVVSLCLWNVYFMNYIKIYCISTFFFSSVNCDLSVQWTRMKTTKTNKKNAYTHYIWRDEWIEVWIIGSSLVDGRYFYSDWTYFINHNWTFDRSWFLFGIGQFARTFAEYVHWDYSISGGWKNPTKYRREWLKWLQYAFDWLTNFNKIIESTVWYATS